MGRAEHEAAHEAADPGSALCNPLLFSQTLKLEHDKEARQAPQNEA